MSADREGQSLSDEFDLIRWIRKQAGNRRGVSVGIGDDCAGLDFPGDAMALVTTDMVIEGVHFRMEEVTPRQVGHKAIARALSDIAAMAGEALAVVVAMAVPKHLSVSWLQEMIRGMIAAADALDVPLVGGDVASGNMPLTVTVTCIGAAAPGGAVLRSGARVTDMLLVTGELGGSSAGRHLRFQPRLREARWLRGAVELHAMIDISDGLAADAGHIASESGVGMELWEEAIPISRDAVSLAGQSGRPPLEHALYDGEDYELLFTAGARQAEDLLERRDLPVKVTCIGEVVAGEGMWIRRRGDTRRQLDTRGWTHEL